MAVLHYRELMVWQKAMEFAVACYKATERFPRTQLYTLSNQLQRSAISIASNIAEGQGRGTTRDFVRFLFLANGSLCEAETQIVLATRLGYLEETVSIDLLNRASEIGRMLNGLIASLNRRMSTEEQ